MEEKLNAVLEKRISMGPGVFPDPKKPSDKPLKSLSTESLQPSPSSKSEITKSRSIDSSREFPKPQDTVDRSLDPRASDHGVSVITSTPLRSRSKSRDPDNVVVITKTPEDAHRSSSTTVRITADSPDPSNSLASNISQVTVVTTHPPVLIDAASTPPLRRTSPTSEVVIVANETNKTQVRI